MVLGQSWVLKTLYIVQQNIYKALDDGKKPLEIFLDLAKAFDMVNHIELMKILPHFGMKNVSLRWFNSYLTNRSRVVKIFGVFSNPLTLKCGVPPCSRTSFVHYVPI